MSYPKWEDYSFAELYHQGSASKCFEFASIQLDREAYAIMSAFLIDLSHVNLGLLLDELDNLHRDKDYDLWESELQHAQEFMQECAARDLETELTFTRESRHRIHLYIHRTHPAWDVFRAFGDMDLDTLLHDLTSSESDHLFPVQLTTGETTQEWRAYYAPHECETEIGKILRSLADDATTIVRECMHEVEERARRK